MGFAAVEIVVVEIVFVYLRLYYHRLYRRSRLSDPDNVHTGPESCSWVCSDLSFLLPPPNSPEDGEAVGTSVGTQGNVARFRECCYG